LPCPIRRGDLVPLLPEYQAKDDTAIHVVYLPERQLVPRIRAFIDYFVEVFREPPWQKPRRRGFIYRRNKSYCPARLDRRWVFPYR
jgi:hypothetical protein